MKTAYPQVMGTCDITLYANIPFDNSYQHHCLVSDRFKYNANDIYQEYVGYTNPACERFIDRRDYKVAGMPYVYKRWTLTGDYNFNFSNGLIASLTLELTPAQTNANYMKLVCGSDIYYYFITGISQVNFDTYNLSLELDVLMTYQDEFLDGMKDVPVFTERKMSHRYTNDGLYLHCADYKTGENTFSGIKPNYIEKVLKLHYADTKLKKIEDLVWLYVCVDVLPNVAGDQYATFNEYVKSKSVYKNKKKPYPLVMMCVPLNATSFTYEWTTEVGGVSVTSSKTYTSDDINKGIRSLIDDGVVHGAKISPYPPFTTTGAITLTGSNVKFTPTSASAIMRTGYGEVAEWTCGSSKLMVGNVGSGHSLHDDLGLQGKLMFDSGFMLVEQQDNSTYIYDDITISNLSLYNSSAPSITSNRYDDPKLLFAPFKKYILNGQYSSEGSQFYPELVYSEYAEGSYDYNYSFETTATAYIGDNNFYTKLRSSWAFNHYAYDKIGLSSAVNYIFPCGTNALEVFNSTQAQSFYTSKVASGVTSGLTIAGGIGSIALGVAGAVGSMGMSAPASAGLIMAGATGLASGTAGLVNSIKSSTAKVEDLKNTPDSITISGSNYITDDNIIDTNGLPYIIVYNCSSLIKEQANDFFYNNGYNVARECYFNTEIKFSNDIDKTLDNNIFGRTIFNYVQLNEDITNKINANIPYVIKKKLSQVFNQGITLWTFFGFSQIYLIYPPQDYDPDYTYDIDKWFMKHKYDNTEYDGSDYY